MTDKFSPTKTEKWYSGPRKGRNQSRKTTYKRKSEEEEITIEPTSPLLLMKNERINQPDDDFLEKQVQTLNAEIDGLYTKMVRY